MNKEAVGNGLIRKNTRVGGLLLACVWLVLCGSVMAQDFRSNREIPREIFNNTEQPARESHFDAQAADDCADPKQYRASSFKSVSGFSRAALNQQGNLVITLDLDADKRVDRIFRIALENPGERKRALSRWSDSEIELQVQTWTVGDREIHRFVPRRSEHGFVVAFHDHKCLDKFISSQPISSVPVYVRTAISIHTPAVLESMTHRSALDSFSERGIFRPKPQQSHDASKVPTQTVQGPLFCQAGGEGAGGCSIDFGGFGGLSAGGCSVSGCEAPSFACCGPGFGQNCTCRTPDDSGGGGGIGDPGGGTD